MVARSPSQACSLGGLFSPRTEQLLFLPICRQAEQTSYADKTTAFWCHPVFRWGRGWGPARGWVSCPHRLCGASHSAFLSSLWVFIQDWRGQCTSFMDVLVLQSVDDSKHPRQWWHQEPVLASHHHCCYHQLRQACWSPGEVPTLTLMTGTGVSLPAFSFLLTPPAQTICKGQSPRSRLQLLKILHRFALLSEQKQLPNLI